jgi:hypothetical protein
MALNVTSLDDLASIVAGLQDRIGALESKIASDEVALNVGWTLLTGFLVFFMQTGFVMVETGGVRRRHEISIMLKNVVGPCVTAISWWLVGFGIAFGDHPDRLNGFIGTQWFVFTDWETSPTPGSYWIWFYQVSNNYFIFFTLILSLCSGLSVPPHVLSYPVLWPKELVSELT